MTGTISVFLNMVNKIELVFGYMLRGVWHLIASSESAERD